MANYLYNGVELPDINTVWTDKETYPYAYILDCPSDNRFYVYFSSARLNALYLEKYSAYFLNGTSYSYAHYQFHYPSSPYYTGSWKFVAERPNGSGTLQNMKNCPAVWASIDILYADGSVYLAASDPVDPNAPVESKLSLSLGSANGDGVALYNGVMLPNIDSVWDKDKYPYVALSQLDGGFGFCSLSAPLEYDSANNGCSVSESCNGSIYAFTGDGWTPEMVDYEGIPTFLVLEGVFWSNYDILNSSDSSIYLAASDPIPLDGMNVIEWDGDTTGRDVFTEWLDFYKVSDDVVSPENLVGSVYRFVGTMAGEPISSCHIFTVEDALSDLPGGAYGMIDVSVGAAVGILPTEYEGASPGIYLPQWENNTVGTSLFAYPASSGGVTDTTAVVNFSCADLIYSESVYRIQAWVYRVADGLDTTTAPTWTSELFAGTTHSESHTFEGLTPATDYAVYGVIWSETDQAATEHNATVTFTTLAGEELDFSNSVLEVTSVTPYANTAVFGLAYTDLPYLADGTVALFELIGSLDDGTEIMGGGTPSSGSGTAIVTTREDIEPNTEYTATFEVYYNGAATGVTASVTFTTLAEETAADSFPMGFASGLSDMPVTKENADHNRWMQGYIVGVLLRSALYDIDDEVWAEVVDGQLRIYRAYNAAQSGDTLEVE